MKRCTEKEKFDDLISYLEKVADSIQICYEKFSFIGLQVEEIVVIILNLQDYIETIDDNLLTFRNRILQLEGIIEEFTQEGD